MLFPIFVAVTAIGMGSAAWSAFLIALGNILTVAIMPAMMNIMVGTMLKAPVNSMRQSTAYAAASAKAQLSRSRENWDRCKEALTLNPDGEIGGCVKTLTTAAGSLNPGRNFLMMSWDTFMGIGLAVVALIISFSIMMLQLRRIPAVIMQIVGSAGGGESSGVGNNPGTALAKGTIKTVTAPVRGVAGMAKGAAQAGLNSRVIGAMQERTKGAAGWAARSRPSTGGSPQRSSVSGGGAANRTQSKTRRS